MKHTLYTLGHSATAPDAFLALLRARNVELVVDVRSLPRSLRFPQFDRIELETSLLAAGIRYVFLGEELGGRPDDPKLYRSDGLVDYRACRRSRQFRTGIDRTLVELEKSDLALLCAEEDPLECHRFLMICPELLPLGVVPTHLRKGGALESQSDAEDRLLQEQGMDAVSGSSLFSTDRGSALEEAYLAQAEKCAFRMDRRVLEPW